MTIQQHSVQILQDPGTLSHIEGKQSVNRGFYRNWRIRNDLRLQRKLPIFRFVTLCSVLSCNEYPCWSNIYH
jgi:hypothetical protein